MTRIKITGHWNGEPIWRYMTASEILLEQINKYKSPYPIKIKVISQDVETNIKING